jgi:flavin-binding protein dodecin
VPATEADLAGRRRQARYDTELRPDLTIQTIQEIQAAGVEPDIWKIEGLDERSDCERLAQTIRADGRDGVVAVVLGRGADDAKVDHWLRQGAPVDGYAGFAIGRSIWTSGVEGFVRRQVPRGGRRGDRPQLQAVHRRVPGRAGLTGARPMAVIKTIDLVGVSTESWRDAAQKALEESNKTLRGVEGLSVLDTSAVVEDGRIIEYHTHVRIKFRIAR